MYTYTTPTKGTGKIVAGTERQHTDRRWRHKVNLIEHGQHPADGTVTAAREYTQLWYFAEQLKPVTGEKKTALILCLSLEKRNRFDALTPCAARPA